MQNEREAMARSMEIVDGIAEKRRDPARCRAMVRTGRRMTGRRYRQCRHTPAKGSRYCPRHDPQEAPQDAEGYLLG